MNQPIQDPTNTRAQAVNSLPDCPQHADFEYHMYKDGFRAIALALLYIGDAILHAHATQVRLAFSNKKAAIKVKKV